MKKQGRVGSVYESFPLVRFSMFSLSVTFSKPLSYAYILQKVKIITPQPSKYHFIITGGSQRHYTAWYHKVSGFAWACSGLSWFQPVAVLMCCIWYHGMDMVVYFLYHILSLVNRSAAIAPGWFWRRLLCTFRWIPWEGRWLLQESFKKRSNLTIRLYYCSH